MGLVIAVSGLPAAGKGEFAAILAATGIPVRSMGDMVRAEVRARGIPEAPHVFGEVATEMRAEHGDDVLAHRLVGCSRRSSRQQSYRSNRRTERHCGERSFPESLG